MGTITQRVSQFRGVNRSVQQNGLDVSYAYNAENVDIIGGKLTNKIGNYRLAMAADVPAARPVVYFTNDSDYIILRDKFIELSTDENNTAPYDILRPASALKDVFNVSGRQIRGVGRSYVRTVLDFVAESNETVEDRNCVIVSGMLGEALVPGSTESAYWLTRGLLSDGLEGKTAVFYLGHNTSLTDSPVSVVCRSFGSGQAIEYNLEITNKTANASGKIATITVKCPHDLSNLATTRAKTDGIYLFSEALEDTLTDETVNNAYMWLKVTDISSTLNDTDPDDTFYEIVFTVESTRNASDITVGHYAFIRGGCSDQPVTFMQMYYGRLFAAASKANTDHPRRLYWSRLPGDGRTIEDWTMDDASVDTSGGHVDIGDPSDGYITGLVVCGGQLLIFTLNRLWRLYGTSPSNYNVELIGFLDAPRISNPIEVNGTVYWLSVTGISYYNGSYISATDDDYNTRHMLEELPKAYQDSMNHETVNGVLFDNSIMFAFDLEPEEDKAVVLRYELQTGNVLRYVVPCENYLQQFTDSMIKNFGVENGAVNYEARYLQALVHEDHSMTMCQWHSWGRQEFGWYDGHPVKSVWESDWDDMRSPEVVKKAQTVLMRGSGEFNLTIESETNKEQVNVVMPESKARVKEVSHRYAEGRTMRIRIESEKPFEIEPYMTMLFEAGARR